MARRQHLDPRWEYDMTAYVGKQLSHTFEVIDASSGDDTVIDLTGFTAAGKIVDEDGDYGCYPYSYNHSRPWTDSH
jgi:hypothetical protein